MVSVVRPRVVVWGLRTSKHSHRYIHSGWYRTLRDAGYEVRWTDDRPGAADALTPGCVVLSVNVASKHLPIRPDCRYVLHNIDVAQVTAHLYVAPPVLQLQVWTRDASGPPLEPGLPCVQYDEAQQKIFQPWGTPFPETSWVREPIPTGLRREFWIGSIWNNGLNQGNAPAIARWRDALHHVDVRFSKVPRGWPDTPGAYGWLVRHSALGAGIVGDWQSDKQYLPCRMFKNLSFGALPVGNNHGYSALFGDDAVVSLDFEVLAQDALGRGHDAEALKRCQALLPRYTHLAALERMLTLVGDISRP